MERQIRGEMRDEREETEKECAKHERNKEINKTLVASCYNNLVLVPGYCSNLLKVFSFGTIDKRLPFFFLFLVFEVIK